jgi:phosphatidylglycerol:prolipoprotein diacylglycerol transferase
VTSSSGPDDTSTNASTTKSTSWFNTLALLAALYIVLGEPLTSLYNRVPFAIPKYDIVGILKGFGIPLTVDFPVVIHGFGILVAIGFILGGNIAMARARRVGQDDDAINRLIFWLVVGVFTGGHIGYGLMYKPEEYLAEPIKFLYIWEGLSSFGGFVVCLPLCIWFFRKEKLEVWAYLDSVAIGLTIGWFFGRLGCFVAHDHPGSPTDFILGVYGMCPGLSDDIACHDMGLYEALWSVSMFGLFLLLDRVPRVSGLYVCLLGAFYGPVRFCMDFLRPESTDVRYAGYTPGQYWSVVLTLLAVGFLVKRLRSGDTPKPWPAVPSTQD